jgi:hypothetical protein
MLSLNAGEDRNATQARTLGEAPIALHGKTDAPDAFRLRANGRTAGGRGKVRLEWEVISHDAPFTGTGLARSASSVDTGPPDSLLGSIVPLSEMAGGLESGTAYRWRARILSHSPYFPRTPWLTMARNALTELDFRTPAVVVAIDGAGQTPSARPGFLEPIHPQPFTAGHDLTFILAEARAVRLSLYDVQGRERAILDAGTRDPGIHSVRWDGRDTAGRRLARGVYFLRLRIGEHVESLKLLWAP